MRSLLLAMVIAAGAAKLQRSNNGVVTVSKKCGPNTKVFISDAEDATGAPQYTQVEMVDGECKSKGVETITHVKFCGPGTLTLSRMSCGRHDYKTHSYEHSASEYTTNCEIIDLKGTNVEGYFGSLIMAC